MKIFIQTLLVTLLFSIIGFSFALADEKLPDISKMSEEEINKLPKDVIEKLPIKELVNRMGGDKFALVFPFLLSDALAKLGYFPPPSEKQIREAIQKFQRDIGQPETGELTKGQFEELQLRSTRITDTPVYLPTFGDEIKVYGYSDYLTTKGTWIIEGEKIYAPINHSEIRCRKSQGTCEVFQALTDIPKLRGTGLFGQVKDSYTLRMSNDTFEIISWTDSEVISQTGAKCRTTIMTINIENKEVFQITRNKGDNECDVGIASLPQLEKPRISKLIPGYKFSYAFWINRKKEARKYLNSDYLKLTKETLKPLEAAKDKKKESSAPKEPTKTLPPKMGIMFPLDPFVVSLAGGEGKRFLKVNISLEMGTPEVFAELKENIQKITDSITALLSSKSLEDVYSVQGKFKLKDEITVRVNRYLVEGHVKDAYFTEFIIQ